MKKTYFKSCTNFFDNVRERERTNVVDVCDIEHTHGKTIGAYVYDKKGIPIELFVLCPENH